MTTTTTGSKKGLYRWLDQEHFFGQVKMHYVGQATLKGGVK